MHLSDAQVAVLAAQAMVLAAGKDALLLVARGGEMLPLRGTKVANRSAASE